MNTWNSSSTHHPKPDSVNVISDSIFGTLYVICTVFGTPGNILAYIYFMGVTDNGNASHGTSRGGTHVKSRAGGGYNKSYFDQLYRIVCLTDTIVCLSVIPNAVAFYSGRHPAWFEANAFCSGWGLLWEILPYFSVCLVGVMSMSRLLILISPLLQLNTLLMRILLALYFCYLLLRSVIPVSLSLAEYIYDTTDVFCFESPIPESNSEGYWRFNTISRLLQLAFPIIPIILSSAAIVSTLFLLSRKQAAKHSSTSHASATITVLIFTLLYIMCNLPGCANYVLMVLALRDGCSNECYHKKYKDSAVLLWFSWNFTYVLCVAFNSAANPIIYCCRMAGFREFLRIRVCQTVLKWYGAASIFRSRKSYCRSSSGVTVSGKTNYSEIQS